MIAVVTGMGCDGAVQPLPEAEFVAGRRERHIPVRNTWYAMVGAYEPTAMARHVPFGEVARMR